MLEVFHTGQMWFYCFMKSLSYFFFFFFFLKSCVLGNVWKLSSAIMKGATNSFLVKKTKWHQMRRKRGSKVTVSIQIYLATYKVSGLQWETVTSWVFAQGEITVVSRSNMFHSVLWEHKIQLSIEQAVSAHFQAVTLSIPSSVQSHILGRGQQTHKGKNKETSSLPFVLRTFWDLVAT